MQKIRKNLFVREIVLLIMLCDIVLMYTINSISCSTLQISNYISIFIRAGFDWICMFFLWSPIRYEEYNEKNPRTYSMGWAVMCLAEYIMFSIYMYLEQFDKVFVSLGIYSCVFIIMRIIINFKQIEGQKDIIVQMEKDLPISVLLVVFSSISNAVNIMVYTNDTIKWVSEIMVLSSFGVSFLCCFYYVKSMRKILKNNLENKDIFIIFLSISIIHIYYFISSLWLKAYDILMEKTIFLLLSVLASVMYICKISSVIKLETVEGRGNG